MTMTEGSNEPKGPIEEPEASWQKEIEAARREGEAEAAERDEIRARAIAFDVELAEAIRTNDRDRALSVMEEAAKAADALHLMNIRAAERLARVAQLIEKMRQDKPHE